MKSKLFYLYPLNPYKGAGRVLLMWFLPLGWKGGKTDSRGFAYSAIQNKLSCLYKILTRITSKKGANKVSSTYLHLLLFAEAGGFEPPVQLPVRQFSKLVVSATHPHFLEIMLNAEIISGANIQVCFWLFKQKEWIIYYSQILWGFIDVLGGILKCKLEWMEQHRRILFIFAD